MATFHVAGLQTYTLSSSIGSTDTSFTLSSFLEPVTGTALTMANLATDINYGTIAPKTTSAEFISFTTITQNANGTCTLGGVVRGLAKKYPYTTDAAYKLPHSGQSQFILSDAPQVLNNYASKTHDETIDGQWTFNNTPISPAGGISDASTTVKGVSTLSVAPASATAPIAVGTNDTRIPTADPTTLFASLATSLITPVVNVFTSSGTWTKDAGLKYVLVELVAGGGAGSGATGSGFATAGGGGGGYSRKLILASSLGATETVTIGAGGAKANGTGGTGGTSSFGSQCSATGGIGGVSTNGGAGGAGSSGDFNTKGTPGGIGSTTSLPVAGFGGGSLLGSGAPGSTTNNNATDATSYGGGGSGVYYNNASGSQTFQGGNGYAGIVIVTEFYNY